MELTISAIIMSMPFDSCLAIQVWRNKRGIVVDSSVDVSVLNKLILIAY